jgi:hypothetical protein
MTRPTYKLGLPSLLVCALVWGGLLSIWLIIGRPAVLAWLVAGIGADGGLDQILIWWQHLVLGLYPRLPVELQRLGPDFFVTKADQVIVRLGLVALVGQQLWVNRRLVVGWLFAAQDVASFYVLFLRWAASFAYLWFGYDIISDLWLRQPMADWHQPLRLVGWIPGLITAPNAANMIIIAALGILCLILWLVWDWVWLGRLVFVTWMIGQAWLYSWGKIDHTYATLNWLMLVVLGTKDPVQYLRLVMVLIAATYGLAGVEKLLTTGLSWAAEANPYLVNHGTAIGQALGQFPAVFTVLAMISLLGQLLSPWLMFSKRRWPIWAVWVLLFHAGTWLLLGAGAWLHPWYWSIAVCVVYHQLYDLDHNMD